MFFKINFCFNYKVITKIQVTVFNYKAKPDRSITSACAVAEN